MPVPFTNNYDEELKKRMELARQQGWKEDEIQRSALIDRTLYQKNVASKKQAQPTPKKESKPSGLKKFLVNTGALIAGAGAGVASAVTAPLTGGASLAGGFAAGAGIEALRRKLLGEKQNLGASALEGGLTIIPGVGKGIKALKGAKAVDAAVDVGREAKVVRGATAEKESLKDAIVNGFKTPEKGGRLTRAGERLRANQRGINPGDKLVNSIKEKPLNSAQATEINQAINKANRGFVPKSVRGQVVGVQAEKQKAGEALTAAAKSNKARVNKDVSKIIETSVTEDRSKILKFDPSNPAHAKINNDYATRLSSAKTPEQILKQRRIFDKSANATFTNPSIEQAIDKELAAVYRKAADKALTKLAPELKPLDKAYSTLVKAEQGLTNNKTKLNPSGFKPAGTSLNGQGVGGPTLQAAKEGAGKVISATGRITANPLVRAGVQQSIGRSLTKPYLETPQPQEVLPPDATQVFASPQTEEEAIVQDLVGSGAMDFESVARGLQDHDTQKNTPQTTSLNGTGLSMGSAELFNQALEAWNAGDAKGAKAIMDFAQIAADFEASSAKGTASGGLDLSDGAIKVISDLQGGLNDIDSLDSLLRANPSKTGNLAGLLGAKPLGFTIDPTASNIQSQIDRVRQVIGKALEGGVLRKEDEEKYKKILPTMRDPQEVALYKLSELKRKLNEDLTNYVTLQGNYGGGSSDVTNLFTPQNAFNTQGVF